MPLSLPRPQFKKDTLNPGHLRGFAIMESVLLGIGQAVRVFFFIVALIFPTKILVGPHNLQKPGEIILFKGSLF